MLRMDVTDLRFERDSFDLVICNHVLEHVEDDRKAMSEIRRVLERTRWAIFQVPLSFTLERTFEDPSITTRQERHGAVDVACLKIAGGDGEPVGLSGAWGITKRRWTHHSRSRGPCFSASRRKC